MLLRRILRRHLVRVSVGTKVLRSILRRERLMEVNYLRGAYKAETYPFAEYTHATYVKPILA